MSDYLFQLESHLSGAQQQALAHVQATATEAGLSLFLAGGAMRDMLGGFPIRDLDFTVEGNALKMAKPLAQRANAEIVSTDDVRRSVEFLFRGSVTVELSMARQERYPKPASRPIVTPSTIYEDLRRRDFTVNSIAMSLNRSSRGLLVDPNNGQGDLDRKELRAVSGYVFYDDPVRMLRAVRLGVRMKFAMDERTSFQFNSAAEAGMPSRITPESLGAELRHIADEPGPGDVMKALEDQKLLGLFSPALAGGKLSLVGLQKLQKTRQLIPFGVDFPVENFSIFLNCLCEKLSAQERSQLARACALSRAAVNAWQKLEGQAKKLERSLKSSKLQRPSLLYQALSDVPGDQILQLLLRSEERLVLDRIKNYLQKYLPAAQEISEKEAAAQTGLAPGTPKFRKAHQELIAQRLDSRPRKVQPTPPPEPVLAAAGGRGRLR